MLLSLPQIHCIDQSAPLELTLGSRWGLAPAEACMGPDDEAGQWPAYKARMVRKSTVDHQEPSSFSEHKFANSVSWIKRKH